jgi:hypothetical protein
VRGCVALIFPLIIFMSDARSTMVVSCDGRYSAQIFGRSDLLVKRDGRRIGVAKVNHHINGGVFSLDGRSLVIYGMPDKIDLRSPQAQFVSVYDLNPRLRMIVRKMYGGGVYEVEIGYGNKEIFVSSRFGFDVMDIKNMKIKSYDLFSEPQFSRQKCKFGN